MFVVVFFVPLTKTKLTEPSIVHVKLVRWSGYSQLTVRMVRIWSVYCWY